MSIKMGGGIHKGVIEARGEGGLRQTSFRIAAANRPEVMIHTNNVNFVLLSF